jgi:hypothetical protein
VSKAYKAGQAIMTFGNVYQPLLQGAVFSLLANSVFFSADAEILRRELIKPWEEECKKKIQGKYGFKP